MLFIPALFVNISLNFISFPVDKSIFITKKSYWLYESKSFTALIDIAFPKFAVHFTSILFNTFSLFELHQSVIFSFILSFIFCCNFSSFIPSIWIHSPSTSLFPFIENFSFDILIGFSAYVSFSEDTPCTSFWLCSFLFFETFSLMFSITLLIFELLFFNIRNDVTPIHTIEKITKKIIIFLVPWSFLIFSVLILLFSFNFDISISSPYFLLNLIRFKLL